jgi:hypothetical protein
MQSISQRKNTEGNYTLLGGKAEGLMTRATEAERQNYVADIHAQKKRLNMPKIMFSGEVKERLGFWDQFIYSYDLFTQTKNKFSVKDTEFVVLS